MATLIDALKSMLKANGATKIEASTNEIVATFRLPSERTQTAKVIVTSGRHGNYHVARCISRACLAENSQSIRHALRVNAKDYCCGCELVTSLDPPAIDITSSVIICKNCEYMERIFFSLSEVVQLADRIESNVMKQDFF